VKKCSGGATRPQQGSKRWGHGGIP